MKVFKRGFRCMHGIGAAQRIAVVADDQIEENRAGARCRQFEDGERTQNQMAVKQMADDRIPEKDAEKNVNRGNDKSLQDAADQTRFEPAREETAVQDRFNCQNDDDDREVP